MHSLRRQFRQRIALIRPLRPPNCQTTRFVTSRAEVHKNSARWNYICGFVAGGRRPQISCLAFPKAQRFAAGIRPLSTNQKEALRYRLKIAAKWAIMGIVICGGMFVAFVALQQDWLDRLYPSPSEWGFLARFGWRSAEKALAEEGRGGRVNWIEVAWGYQMARTWCEKGGIMFESSNPPKRNEHLDETIPGVDMDDLLRHPVSPLFNDERIGVDISEKTEPWRRAYFHAMMGLARVAEVRSGWVRDTKRKILFPSRYVIGPSNPYPAPQAPGAPASPLEEDCEPVFNTPEHFYVRILTTKGFSPRQRMDAALAYAAWLDLCGESKTALDLYSWSFDIAYTGLGPEAPNIINKETAVVKRVAPFVTPNILNTATALASHHARSGDIPKALNIYLSVLRARRASPEAPKSQQYKPKGPDLSLKTINSVMYWLTSLARNPTMDSEPPSGNEPFTRTPAGSCEESATMVYVGEILFATSSQKQRDGLSWTRDAANLAEAGYRDRKLDAASKKLCAECMRTALENWQRMVGVLVDEEERKSQQPRGIVPKAVKRAARFWIPAGSDGDVERLVEEGDWKEELNFVMAKRARFLEEQLMAQLGQYVPKRRDWFGMK